MKPQAVVYIYGLTEPDSDFIRYIGHAKSLEGRFRSHLKEAAKQGGTYKRHWLRKLFREGLQPGVVQVEKTTAEHCQARERYWIKNLKLTNNLTNATAGGDGVIDPSDATRRKISRAAHLRESKRTKHPAQGMTHSADSRRRIGESLRNSKTWRKNQAKAMRKRRGVPFTEEHKAKIGAANRGKVRTPEMRARMSESNKGKNNWTGRHHTEETKAKLSAAKLGKTPWLGRHHSEDSKQKMRAANIGKTISEETRAKLSALHAGNQHALGHVHTPLQRAAISQSLRTSEKFRQAMKERGLRQRGKPHSPEHRAAIAAAHQARAERIRQEKLAQQNAA